MAVKNKGLGKGLGALLGAEAEIETRRNPTKPAEKKDESGEILVKIRLIEPNRTQPRKNFNEEELQELADSIRQHGVIQPLIVTKEGERYQIVAGERRWRAARLAGLREVPVIVREYEDQKAAEVSLIENIERKDLDPIEEAQAFKKLIEDYNLTQEELSERMSRSRTSITNALRLLKLPGEVQQLLVDGKLSQGHAKVLLGMENDEAETLLAHRIVEEELSVRATEEAVRLWANPRKPRPVKKLKNEAAYRKTASDLTEKLGTKVRINRKSEHAGRIDQRDLFGVLDKAHFDERTDQRQRCLGAARLPEAERLFRPEAQQVREHNGVVPARYRHEMDRAAFDCCGQGPIWCGFLDACAKGMVPDRRSRAVPDNVIYVEVVAKEGSLSGLKIYSSGQSRLVNSEQIQPRTVLPPFISALLILRR